MNLFKKYLKKVSPGFYLILASVNFFIKCRKHLRPSQNLIHRVIFKNDEIEVLGGPFKGMIYYNKTIWGTITSKWLGFYELEIQDVINEIITNKYPLIVDIGAAEGYYAVGLARNLPESKIISFDTDPIGRYRQRQLAKLNNVTNLDIKKYCSHEMLEDISDKNVVIICDIEGYEYDLLNPILCPSLSKVDLLVETHHYNEISASCVAKEIEGRFSNTHHITRFVNQKRNKEAAKQRIPSLAKLADNDLDFALDEGRYEGQIWLWMKSNDKYSK